MSKQKEAFSIVEELLFVCNIVSLGKYLLGRIP